MTHRFLLATALFTSLSGACTSDPAAHDGAAGTGGTGGNSGATAAFVRRAGQELVTGENQPLYLAGMAFGNNVWGEPRRPVLTHHDERDFARLREWGMNVVRFYLNYQLFEDDGAPYQYKQSGWDWIDQNLAWAKANGVYLFLNMHVPQGGFQSTGLGNALWSGEESQANQDRFVALWRAIAERYKDEPAIAGFDLLNEPRPTQTREQWEQLANRLVSSIREVDQRHVIVVERTNSVGDDWSNDANMNFFLVPDENVLYEFHSYAPFEYTHQYASWVGLGEGGVYPDETRISSAGLEWYAWSWDPKPPPAAPPGDSDWTYYESEPYALTDPEVAAIGVALVSELNAGTAYFDDVVVKEFDETGTFVRNVFEQDLEAMQDWYFWKAGAGSAAVSDESHSGSHSLSISATDHDANLSNTTWRFAPKPGFKYSVGGYIKGVGLSDDSRPSPDGDWTQVSRAIIRLDYFSSDGPVLTRNKASLEAEVDRFVKWGTDHGVPLYLGEFGCMHFCFEDGRGGERFVADMIDILETRRVPFTYHTYHEEAFGVFTHSASELPNPAYANQALIDTFKAELTP